VQTHLIKANTTKKDIKHTISTVSGIEE